jgi:hypothetical protein
MSIISEFTVGNAISVQVTDEAFEILASPPGTKEKIVAKSPIKAVVSFNTIWTAHLGVFTWADGSNSVEFSWSKEPVPPPFDDVVGRLRQTMKIVDGYWLLPVRAGKKGAKDRPTLNGLTWLEIDGLLGSDGQSFFKSLGHVEFGRYGDMASGAGAMANLIGARVKLGDESVLVAIHVVTRALAVLRNLSK